MLFSGRRAQQARYRQQTILKTALEKRKDRVMSQRAAITTHILDLVRGQPAANVAVRLYNTKGLVASARTDDDGRVVQWDTEFDIQADKYRFEFDVAPYFDLQQADCFYEDVHISFRVKNVIEHYHVPLLLSPFGYSTYRGS
jgi:hydroxyisourate hydrolase